MFFLNLLWIALGLLVGTIGVFTSPAVNRRCSGWRFVTLSYTLFFAGFGVLVYGISRFFL